MASVAIGAIGAVTNIFSGLLQGHTARLNGATNENAACAQIAPAVQADLVSIAQDVSSGKVTPANAQTLIGQLDQQVSSYLEQQVGKPGTSWQPSYSGTPWGVSTNPFVDIGQGAPCNKQCTVGCCLYYNVWKPAFTAFETLLQTEKAFSVTINAIPSNKYGFPGTSPYTINVSIPAPSINNVESSLTSAVNSILGTNSTVTPSSTINTDETISLGGISVSAKTLLLLGGAFLLGLVLTGRKEQ